jgi:hypothetical protein
MHFTIPVVHNHRYSLFVMDDILSIYDGGSPAWSDDPLEKNVARDNLDLRRPII